MFLALVKLTFRGINTTLPEQSDQLWMCMCAHVWGIDCLSLASLSWFVLLICPTGWNRNRLYHKAYNRNREGELKSVERGNKSRDNMVEKKQETVLKKGPSFREQARIDEVRGKGIIGTVFGDILLKHSKINRKNMSWNKRDGTKLRALMYISDCPVSYKCVFLGQ